MRKQNTLSLRQSLRRVTFAGCLALVYFGMLQSPARTYFFHEIGATEFHFGLLAGIPFALVSMQFIGAAITNRLRRRKPWFMTLMIASRLTYIPIAFLPILFPQHIGPHMATAMILMVIVATSMMHIGAPSWFSWMADMIPHRVMSRYWGVRHRFMHLTWIGTYIAMMILTLLVDLPITVVFPVLAVIGVAAGVIDILLFIRIPEPHNVRMEDGPIWHTFLEPFRHQEYRRFLLFRCCMVASMMSAAGFLQLYAKEVLGLPVWVATLVWCTQGLGNVLAAPGWGRLADRHGHRPLIMICATFKPLIILTFMLVTPRTVLWILPVVFIFDGALNAGNMIASHGFMMTMAPRKNRSMFIASMLGFTGICGGIAAILGGSYLEALGGMTVDFIGRSWTSYHILFLISFGLRCACIVLVRGIRQQKSSHPVHVLNEIMGVWPYRFRLFPVGLYRNDKQIDK